MKTIIRNLALTLALITTQLGPNLAHAGKGSGGGNGDAAFALQRMAEANPGLKPHEVLLQAFEEAQGRIPQLNFKPGDRDTEEEAAILPSYEKTHNYLMMLPLEQPEGANDGAFAGVQSFYAKRVITHTGPLLGSVKRSPMYMHLDKISRAGWHAASQLPSQTGLVFGHSYNNKPEIEFRQYNSKIVIYVLYPNSDGRCEFSDWRSKPLGKYCNIGYAWAD